MPQHTWREPCFCIAVYSLHITAHLAISPAPGPFIMVVRLIKPVLAPVLIAQAKRLRKVALAMPEPTGQRHGVAACVGIDSANSESRVLSLLIAGDSSAAGVGAETQDGALASQLAFALAQRIRRDVH